MSGKEALIRYSMPIPLTGMLEEREAVLPFVQTGGAEGNRTLDLLNAIEALSQLSYSPTD